MPPLDTLLRHQFIVVTGKGGVGKSVTTAALGRLLASRGRRVLMLEVDPRETLHELSGIAPSGGEVLHVAPGLLLQNVQPRHVMEELVREHLKMDVLVRRVTTSPVFEHFADAAPGLKEMTVLGHAWRVLNNMGPRAVRGVDLVLLDAPATGHGVAMLAAPLVVSEVVDSGPFGEMARNLRDFVLDTERVGVVIVTLAEEMPVTESLELLASMDQRLGRRPDWLVVNGVYPRIGRERRLPGEGAELWRRRRAINDRELARLAAAWRGPLFELPLVPVERGPALVEALQTRLTAALAAGEASRVDAR
jgi:anion-transporting  ArsA/GET3 family ATPase